MTNVKVTVEPVGEVKEQDIFKIGNFVKTDGGLLVRVSDGTPANADIHFCGIVIEDKTQYHPEGHSSIFWGKEHFRQFRGKITIEVE